MLNASIPTQFEALTSQMVLIEQIVDCAIEIMREKEKENTFSLCFDCLKLKVDWVVSDALANDKQQIVNVFALTFARVCDGNNLINHDRFSWSWLAKQQQKSLIFLFGENRRQLSVKCCHCERPIQSHKWLCKVDWVIVGRNEITKFDCETFYAAKQFQKASFFSISKSSLTATFQKSFDTARKGKVTSLLLHDLWSLFTVSFTFLMIPKWFDSSDSQFSWDLRKKQEKKLFLLEKKKQN